MDFNESPSQTFSTSAAPTFNDRHRKVLHDFYHLDLEALQDLIDAGLIDLSPMVGKRPTQTYPNPIITPGGWEHVKDWQIVD